jgi:putative nucleotidyltransferase with HDIG domain
VRSPTSPRLAGSTPRPLALQELPPLPQVAVRVLDVLARESGTIQEVVEALRLDPAFGAEILRLANSAAYAGRSRADSLKEAVLRLGNEPIRALTLTVALRSLLGRARPGPFHHATWQHSLAGAFIARSLAPGFDLDADRGYTAGLLHDVGRLALLLAHPRDYAALALAAERDRAPIRELEQARFELDHTEAGRVVASEWGFPEELVEAVARHHDADPPGRAGPPGSHPPGLPPGRRDGLPGAPERADVDDRRAAPGGPGPPPDPVGPRPRRPGRGHRPAGTGRLTDQSGIRSSSNR